MNRRGFLRAILVAGVAPAVVGSGVLMPVRALARPVLEFSPVEVGDEFMRLQAVPAGMGLSNQLWTASAITREALRILERELVEAHKLERDFLRNYAREGDQLVVRRTPRFVAELVEGWAAA